MKKTILIFSALIIAILLLFQISKYSVMEGDLKFEFVLGGIAIVFFIIGIYINRKTLRRRELLASDSEFEIDKEQLAQWGISDRESEVLVELSMGLSNKEIADKLFVSENTVKTHVSNIFSKLNVKRRTQAIKRAKELKIIRF